MLPDSFLEELRYRSDIETVVGGYLQLKRKGKNLTGLCPFHSEKTPSFTVYPESQSFYCFGCGAGGDVITFVRRIENLDYMETIRLLAQRAGVSLPEDSMDDRTARQKTRILEINRETARFFHDQLHKPRGEGGLKYLHERGLTDRTIRKFGLGWVPSGWQNLTDHLISKGYSRDDIVAAAVAVNGKRGLYDMFRERVMFPIIDLRGSVIGFGGRIMGDGGPKYLNSPDTMVFKKSRNLFALNFAKASKRKQLILCEGYMDVIALHQAGFDNAVATLGTSLTEEQARIISQYATEVVIAYDSDSAGQTAATRAINIFSATGLRVRILTLNGAKDPDEYIKKFGSARFEMLLEGSSDATEYNIGRIRQRHDTQTSQGKVAFLREVVTLLCELKNPLELEVYAAKISSEIGVNKQALILEVEQTAKRRRENSRRKEDRELRAFVPNPQAAGKRHDPERHQKLTSSVSQEKLLALLLHHPDCYKEVRQRLGAEHFSEKYRHIFEVICQKFEQEAAVNFTTMSQQLEPSEIDLLAGLTTPQQLAVLFPELVGDYVQSILDQHQNISPQQMGEMSVEEWSEIFKKKA